MAIFKEIDPQELAEWLKDRPQIIKDMAADYPPNVLYRLKTTGQRVTLVSYGEDRTVRVAVRGEYNLVPVERDVVGVELGDLEECQLPTESEPLGVIFTEPEEVAKYHELVRKTLEGELTQEELDRFIREAGEKFFA